MLISPTENVTGSCPTGFDDDDLQTIRSHFERLVFLPHRVSTRDLMLRFPELELGRHLRLFAQPDRSWIWRKRQEAFYSKHRLQRRIEMEEFIH